MGIIGDGLMRSSTRRAFVKELSKILRDNMLVGRHECRLSGGDAVMGEF